MDGHVVGIFVAYKAGYSMESVQEIKAIAGKGLEGDRYCNAVGSFNKGREGIRQVTLINATFFPGSGFDYAESRRNIIVSGIELMWLIGKEFKIGAATFRGVTYCDPCYRPSLLRGKLRSFKDAFFDRGGLVAEVIEGGEIKVNDLIIPPEKNY